MSKKTEQALETAQGNAFPAMIDSLADELGVTADSLRRLALGWMPIVEFKKGKNFQGWWAIPERDSDGTPIGISLRSRNHNKVMLPGSTHGLIYEVNPDHERGDKGYDAGAHNWIRTMDAGHPCPVCGKPDGCLLSADDPSNPKAVVCIREKTGAAKPLKFGHLHLLKPEAQLDGRAVLPDNGGPIVVVEGMSDTATAMDLGFNALGRPSNLACMDMLAAVVRGRDVIIVGENDRKPDGREPGKEGMIAAFQMVRHTCKSATMVMPPEHIKDLRVWKTNYELTRDVFLAHVAEAGQDHAVETVLTDSRPTTLATAFLNDTARVSGRYLLKRWMGNWYRYINGKYTQLDEETFEQPIWRWSKDKFIATDDKMQPIMANTSFVSNLSAAAAAELLVHHRILPCWINDESGPDPMDLIVFNNGIVHVSKYLSGADDYLIDPTPDLFTTFAVPYEFDTSARCPSWLRFLRECLGDDHEKVNLLQEWFGYCLVPDTKYHKMMVLAGVARGGKGTICHILRHVMGSEQCVATKLDELGETFELESWMNALVAIDDDAHLPPSRDGLSVLSMLKGITGDGFQRVKQKYKSKLSVELKTRLIIAVNELPELPDYMGAMAPRINLVTFTNSFKGRENFDLRYQLEPEAPGILLWALEGLRRLRENQKFTVPESSRQVMSEWAVDMNPLSGFITECCEEDREGFVMREELFDAWTGWSMERRIRPMTRTRFYERIKSSANFPITFESHDQDGHKYSIFRGLKLKDWAVRKFNGRPQ